MSRLGTRYSLGAVEDIVQTYEELVCRADTDRQGLTALIKILDFRRAMRYLPQGLRAVVLVHGVAGYSNMDAARHLEVSEGAIRKRYRKALEHLQVTMNGGYD